MFFKPSLMRESGSLVTNWLLSSWEGDFDSQESAVQIQISWAVGNMVQNRVSLDDKQKKEVRQLLLKMCGNKKEKVQSNALRTVCHLMREVSLLTLAQVHTLLICFFGSRFNKIHQMLNEGIYKQIKHSDSPEYFLTLLSHNEQQLLKFFLAKSLLKSNNRLTSQSKSTNLEQLLTLPLAFEPEALSALFTRHMADMSSETVTSYYS